MRIRAQSDIKSHQFPDQKSPVQSGSREYYAQKGIEAIDVIEGFDLDFCLGNAVKYILRCGRKTSDRSEDLEKAIWYLQRVIQRDKNASIES